MKKKEIKFLLLVLALGGVTYWIAPQGAPTIIVGVIVFTIIFMIINRGNP